MKAFNKIKMAAALALTLGTGAANALVLDTFDYATNLEVNGANPVATQFLEGVTKTNPAGDVEYKLEHIAGLSSEEETTAFYGNGELFLSNKGGAESKLTLTYSDLTPPLPVGPIDFTDAGASDSFYLDIVTADNGFQLEFQVLDVNGLNAALATLYGAAVNVFNATDAEKAAASDAAIGVNTVSGQYAEADNNAIINKRVHYGFNNFVGIDFTQVLAVRAIVTSKDGQAAGDLILAEVGTVPEPTTLAVLGLTLLGAAGMRRKAK